ncbi:protein transport protein S31 [Dimargaris xerosporica]|nr:protein transport protein S31 [Dimargaris xerosporica]
MPPTAGPGPHQLPRGGPPPGQRPPSAMRGPQPMAAYPSNGSRPQSRPGTPQAAQQSRPGTPGQPATKYPPGDRSHIADNQKPIFTALQGALQQARSVTGPAQKRVLDDTEKRLNQLFDLMNEGNLPSAMEGPLLSLAQALQHRDYPQAHQVYMKMIHTNFDSSQRWMMGAKRLVETLKSSA